MSIRGAEDSAAFPDRRCEFAGAPGHQCSGNVTLVWDHQLCASATSEWEEYMRDVFRRGIEKFIERKRSAKSDAA